MTSLLPTPISAWHKAHGAKMAPFAGWDMPIQYSGGIIAEHLHTRAKASIFDICHMGEFLLNGKGATDALARALTINFETLKVQRCRYGFLLNKQGGVMDDLIVYRLAAENYMIVVNAACRASDFATIVGRLPRGISLSDISSQTGKIDLQGPESLAALEKALPGEDWKSLPYFGLRQTSYRGRPLLVSRTGYTGELGYELYVHADQTEELWSDLAALPGVAPAGLGARDTLRLEVGLPLYGQDLDSEHTPVEAGYSGMLTSTAAYVGREGARQARNLLIGLAISGRRSARHHDRVFLADGREAGVVTSASFAPSLGHAVALAYVKAEYAGAESFVVRAAKTELPAVRVALPFYTEGTARKKFD
jgi:aminomethyltransferase